MSFSAQFVKSHDYYYPISFCRPAVGEPSARAKKIFIIKQSVRPFDAISARALPAANPAGRTIRRILIFDDHPDSLRLVFGRSASPKVDRTTPHRASRWEPILGAMLITGALLLIFLPFFLKLAS